MMMENYSRLVIDVLKQALSDYVASGEIDVEQVKNAILRLEFEIDRRIVARESTEELEALRNDLFWLNCDLFDYEQE
jgi:hypothetical protein